MSRQLNNYKEVMSFFARQSLYIGFNHGFTYGGNLYAAPCLLAALPEGNTFLKLLLEPKQHQRNIMGIREVFSEILITVFLSHWSWQDSTTENAKNCVCHPWKAKTSPKDPLTWISSVPPPLRCQTTWAPSCHSNSQKTEIRVFQQVKSNNFQLLMQLLLAWQTVAERAESLRSKESQRNTVEIVTRKPRFNLRQS